MMFVGDEETTKKSASRCVGRETSPRLVALEWFSGGGHQLALPSRGVGHCCPVAQNPALCRSEDSREERGAVAGGGGYLRQARADHWKCRCVCSSLSGFGPWAMFGIFYRRSGDEAISENPASSRCLSSGGVRSEVLKPQIGVLNAIACLKSTVGGRLTRCGGVVLKGRALGTVGAIGCRFARLRACRLCCAFPAQANVFGTLWMLFDNAGQGNARFTGHTVCLNGFIKGAFREQPFFYATHRSQETQSNPKCPCCISHVVLLAFFFCAFHGRSRQRSFKVVHNVSRIGLFSNCNH